MAVRPWRSLLSICRPAAVAALVAAVALPVAGVGPAGAATAKRSGSVSVLYAGSLVNLMRTAVDGAFHRATGYKVTGISGGSTALAQEIKGGVYRADVFISAAPSSNKLVEGKANGDWVRWYLTFATSPLLLGYNPAGKFVKTIKTEPWWKVVTKPGFLVGRTNPVTDPKGRLVVKAVDQAAKRLDSPSLKSIVLKATDIFPETAMVGRLQAGELDAGFFYKVEAAAGHIPTVPLAGVKGGAVYTITVVAKAPHPTAADAFVSYMVGGKAKALLKKDGLVQLKSPVLTGDRSAVPKSMRKLLK